MIGPVQNVKVGQIFTSRRALHDENVHRGLMRGIAPQGSSIVLSGGYIDDIDEGELIIYTGEGGRDPETGRQRTDQTLTGGNAALAKNYVEGNPVRVNRGGNLDSKFAPDSGYRYDGLYMIDSYWSKKGRDGFAIWRYRLVRLEGQPPLGQVEDEGDQEDIGVSSFGTVTPARSNVTTSRVIRNSAVGNKVKQIYDYKCQICGISLETPAGPYAECCHIRPLGKPHNGPDTLDNVLCLCPNHHVLFDSHAIHLSDEFYVVETGEEIRIEREHNLNAEHIQYHRNLVSVKT